MEKQLNTVIKNQDIKGLEVLIKDGLNISEMKLVDVFKVIFNHRREQKSKKTEEHSSLSLIDRISENDSFLALENYLDTKFIKLFISHGVDIEYFSYSKEKIVVNNYLTDYQNSENILLNCFQFAIWFYDKELIKYFVEQGADANQEILFFRKNLDNLHFQASPLEVAYNHNDIDLMEYLIAKGATITGNISDNEDDCALEGKKLLFKSGIHPDQLFWQSSETAWQGLPYQCADQDNFVELIKLFIEYGVDVNRGCTINKILTASQLNNDDILELYKLILKAGLDVNCKDRNGNTPLSILANTSHILDLGLWGTDPQLEYIIVNSLIDYGTNVNVKNNIGMTPLMQASQHNNEDLVALLLKNGADINLKSEMTAYDLSSSENIRKLITDTRNHTPQKLVKLLTNFTIDKPIKSTTHNEFGDSKELEDFDGYMAEVKKQFDTFKDELKELSPNLYKKIYTFLMETNPKNDYSWCSKVKINIGWSSLDGLKKWCDSGNNPFDFELPESLSKSIEFPTDAEVTTFGEVINLFKEEIEIRRDFKNMRKVFRKIGTRLGKSGFTLSTQKIDRQFYTDVEKFTVTLDKIFDGVKKHNDHKNIEVEANEFDDGTIELRITQINSLSTLNAKDLFEEAEDGDFADIKANLTNLCDWSVEGSFEENSFRINYLKSNNVKDIVELDNKPAGFTHILRFYKR